MTAREILITTSGVAILLFAVIAGMAALQPAHSETPIMFGGDHAVHRVTFEDICG